MTQDAAATYVDFAEFRDGLSEADRETLRRTRVLFCYPVLSANEYELAEHPVSQRLLMAVARAVGCAVDSGMAQVVDGTAVFSAEPKMAPDVVVIHPMINLLEHLPTLVAAYKARFPGCRVVMQNSDQHQHEKLVGGPRSAELARALMARVPGVDWVVRGFAEHALLALLLGRPNDATEGRAGPGGEPARFFTMASLPPAEPPSGGINRDRSIRVQRARGCLSSCTYCIEGQANKATTAERSWDGMPVERFVDQLADLAAQGYFFINVIDSSFEDPGRKGLADLGKFCRLVVERGLRLSFKLHLRAENALRLTPDELRTMKAAGVDVLVVGLESGSQVELDFFRKIAAKEVSRAAFNHIEAPRLFCNILGYMMFSPISTVDILREKVEFLRDINRGWDFLNLTNRVLVFWGTAIHRQLIDAGLADDGPTQLGYAPYRFRDGRVAVIDRAVNTLKRERPALARLNNLIYDAMNLESRMLNPANAAYLEKAGAAFTGFRDRLEERKARLSGLYCDGFQSLLDNPAARFLPGFDGEAEIQAQQAEIRACLSFVENLPEPPTTLYLHTWLSVVNRFGVKAS
ncbi:hypothetical protein [Azospirillum sp.]|uniref:hypothetical protein n=1 Tax=Azospirillum sp. TaxID=34012 RepID=UPI002D5D83C6|nr:hypothetical protein [Azospirillum sp.]HYD70492.1 hypothetical protein [Azospirillum sp.]